MLNFYYVNKNAQPTGEHEVHTLACKYVPSVDNRVFLGMFDNSEEAVKEARRYYSNVDGCYFCCPKSHTK